VSFSYSNIKLIETPGKYGDGQLLTIEWCEPEYSGFDSPYINW
jgi:hypothetical protein